MDRLKVGQINLHHSKDASAVFYRRLVAGDFDIALVQEPWIHNGRVSGLGAKGYSIFYDTLCPRPRACIVANSKLNVLNMVNYLCGDTVAVKVIFSNNGVVNDCIFVSAYLPYEDKDPLNDQAKAFFKSCITGHKFVFGCDANAHHTLWGSSDCNKRGDDLMEYILCFNLCILNRGNEPTFVTRNRREVIDLTLCNSSCVDYISDWKVSDAITASDHQLITFSFKGPLPLKVKGRNPRYTDWVSYRKDLKQEITSVSGKLNSVDDVELAVDQLQQAILSAYHRNCKVANTSSPRQVPWWSSELSNLRKHCRKLFNRAKKNGDWQAYRDALTTYTKAIRKAKRCSWQSFCSGINDISATARVVKIMSKDNRCALNAIKLPNGKFSETGDEILAEMLRVHFPNSLTPNMDSNILNPNIVCDRNCWEIAKRVVSLDKIVWAINSFKPFKTPGMDDIIPALLKQGSDILAPVLCRIFRCCIVFGYIPTLWRYTKVVFIPKIGKDNYFEAKSFRPISLTSFLLKTLEKLVDRYLRDCVLVDNPLSSCQHAYQPGKSTSSALYNLSFILEKSINAKEIALAAFLDIEGAFDRVSVNTIVSALNDKGVNITIIRWISQLLTSRYVCASALGCNMTVHAIAGCPQGGVLSPILWCMVVDSLLIRLANLSLAVIGYADDVVIVARGKFGVTISGLMNDALKQVALWCSTSGLTVNPSKTGLVAFSRKKDLGLRDIFFSGEKLVLSSNVKFLGVYFDNRLNWSKHLDYCICKANRVFWSCRGSIGKTWGLSPKAVHWLYTMIVCPIITYGAIAWWSKTRLASVESRLNRLQRMACVAISGCIRTTPTAALELLLGLLPLHSCIEVEALTCMRRFRRLGFWMDYSRYLSWGLLNSCVTEHPSFVMPCDDCVPKYAFHKPFKIHFPSRVDWSRAPKWTKGRCLVWYTDGSKCNTLVGAGVCCLKDDTRLFYPLGKFATVFQAEVFAILMCCRVCLDRGYRNLTIRICSDSQAALLSLLKCSITSKLVWECYTVLCDLASHNRVSLYWVPGHRGIPGNELADELARLGSSTPFMGPEPVLGISSNMVRDVAFKTFRQTQYCNWRNSGNQRQAKELSSGCPSVRHKELLKLNRKGLSRVVGLLTGHCTLKRHLSIMGVKDDPLCRGCHIEEETSKHILCDCEVFSAHRFEHLGRHIIESWELQDIPVRCLLNFASATGLFV